MFEIGCEELKKSVTQLMRIEKKILQQREGIENCRREISSLETASTEKDDIEFLLTEMEAVLLKLEEEEYQVYQLWRSLEMIIRQEEAAEKKILRILEGVGEIHIRGRIGQWNFNELSKYLTDVKIE